MIEWVTMGVLAAVLMAAAAFDLWTHKIPNALTYPAILLGLAWWAVIGAAGGGPKAGAHGLDEAVIGMLAGLVPMAVIFALGGLGGGDVKLMAAVGAISASWQCVLSTMVYAFVFGAVMAVIVMIKRGVARETATRLANAAMQMAARTKPDLPSDSPRIPFALAIAAGGMLAGAEVLLGLPTPWAPF